MRGDQPQIDQLQHAITAKHAQQALERLGEHANSWDKLRQEAATQNREGMAHLRKGERTEAFQKLTAAQELLTRAEGACASEEERKLLAAAWADTISNTGIYHKRGQNHAVAVRCLLKALKLHKTAGSDLRTILAANLNLSACYSEAEMPEAALRHALAAVELAGQQVAAIDLAEDSSATGDDGLPQGRADDYAMLAVAYHKVAEAHEGLRDWVSASFSYTQAYEVVKRSLGPHHRLTRSFERSSRCPHRAELIETAVCGQSLTGNMSFYQNNSRPATSPAIGRRQHLPSIPPGSTRRRIGAGIDLRGYKLDNSHFPVWPPEAASREEQAWYSMARQHRGMQKAQAHAQLQGAACAEGPTHGGLSARGGWDAVTA